MSKVPLSGAGPPHFLEVVISKVDGCVPQPQHVNLTIVRQAHRARASPRLLPSTLYIWAVSHAKTALRRRATALGEGHAEDRRSLQDFLVLLVDSVHLVHSRSADAHTLPEGFRQAVAREGEDQRHVAPARLPDYLLHLVVQAPFAGTGLDVGRHDHQLRLLGADGSEDFAEPRREAFLHLCLHRIAQHQPFLEFVEFPEKLLDLAVEFGVQVLVAVIPH
mmetsp:Transcript_53883/g.128080  ORF Transcript_53883/g.128080 Transcript_53883/m.128080 type:complete len:220 (+) Transcript_53883:33-692(+)